MTKALWALVGLLLVGVGVVIGMAISKDMTPFGRGFVMANAAAVLIVLAMIGGWLARGK